MSCHSFRGWFCLFFAAATFAGCGESDDIPDLGRVTGKVTLGGQPVAKATVQFLPKGGRPSVGITDANGLYELGYVRNSKGAVLGLHTVRISTYQKADEDSGEPAAPETIPAKYNLSSTLSHEVKAGKNEFNFDLDGKAEVLQPNKFKAKAGRSEEDPSR